MVATPISLGFGTRLATAGTVTLGFGTAGVSPTPVYFKFLDVLTGKILVLILIP